MATTNTFPQYQFPLIFLIIITLTLANFPQTPLGETPTYVCPYPCLPPPIPGSITTENCPPPPMGPTYYESPPPPAPKQHYYYSPPPPPSSGYIPSYYPDPPPGAGGSGLFPYGNAPPPPDPILPYFPFYFKHPPLPPGESSASSLTMVNQPRDKSSLLGFVFSLIAMNFLL